MVSDENSYGMRLCAFVIAFAWIGVGSCCAWSIGKELFWNCGI